MIAKPGKDIQGAPGCLPNERQKLLLKAACAPQEEACRAWRAWRQLHDLTAPDAVSVRLLPWIYIRREELHLSPADSTALEGLYRFAWMTNQRLMNSAALVVRSLRAEGIDVILLKGIALLMEAYQDDGGRYMEDFDIMVREAQLESAIEILKSLAWKPAGAAPLSALTIRWRHSHDFQNPNGVNCDVHWRLLRRPNEPVDEEPLWNARRPILIRSEPASILSVSDTLLHLFVHGLSWQRVPPIRWVLDVHLLLRHHTPDWLALLSEAERRGVMLPVMEAITVYDELLPGEIPHEIRIQAGRHRPTRKQRLAYEQVSGPYEEVSWRVALEIYVNDLKQARSLGRVPANLSGTLQHLCLYWKVKSPLDLPGQFIKRLLSKKFNRAAV